MSDMVGVYGPAVRSQHRRVLMFLSFTLLFFLVSQLMAHSQALAADLDELSQKVDALEKKVSGKDYGYKDGFFIETDDGNYSLKFRGRMQARYQYFGVDGAPDNNSFSLRRARLLFSGNLINKNLTYMFKPAFDNSAASILDLFANYRILSGLQIKVGQFKVPYSREFLALAWNLSFTDYSNQVNNFGLNRDIGVNLHGTFFDKLLCYDVFVFNGSGRAAVNSNKDMMTGARLDFNLAGTPGYRINDFEYSESPQFGVGAAGAYDFGSDNAAVFGNKLARGTIDTIFLYRGFSIEAEAHYLRNTTSDAYNYGFEGQVGYFIVPKRFELAGRGANTVRKKGGALGGGNVNTYEATGALGYYFLGRDFKLATDYTFLGNNGGVAGQKAHQFRLQLQLMM